LARAFPAKVVEGGMSVKVPENKVRYIWWKGRASRHDHQSPDNRLSVDMKSPLYKKTKEKKKRVQGGKKQTSSQSKVLMVDFVRLQQPWNFGAAQTLLLLVAL
jgi:hypothetical protein